MVHNPMLQSPHTSSSAAMAAKLEDLGPDVQDEKAAMPAAAEDVEDVKPPVTDDGTIKLQHQSFTDSWSPQPLQEKTDRIIPNQPLPERSASEQTSPLEDEIQLVATSPAPNISLDTNLPPNTLQPTTTSHTQDYSALVSPPDSSHTDAAPSPSSTKPHQTPSNSPSRPSSEQPKQTQRYTPESGIARRASSSARSAPTNHKNNMNNSTSRRNSPLLIMEETPNRAKRAKARASSGEAEADGESLRLIRELAAQDLGLRRRGRV